MIFVILGTQDKSFRRLLHCLESEIESGKINDDIIVQAGHTAFKSKTMQIYDFMEHKIMIEFMEKSDIIISHGGVGTILDALKLKKKVIAVPRLAKYREHTNDHQLELIESLASERYIIDGSDISKISYLIRVAKSVKLKEYKFNNKPLVSFLRKTIASIPIEDQF